MPEKKPTREARRGAAVNAARSSSRRESLRNEALIAALVMVIALCVLYPQLVFQDQIFFSGDNEAAASFASVGRAALERGVYPLWNPYLFSGMPSYASLSFTPYVYPVSYIVGILEKYLFFPTLTWFLFHAWLMGMGVYLLLRHWRRHWAAAMAGGVLMMWMPNLVAVGANGHGSQASACAYLPLALLLWDRVWRGRGTLVNGAALALVFGLSMLRGHLQISYYTYALVALHILFFGVARIVDGARGRPTVETMMPRRWRVSRRDAQGGSGVGPALAEVAYAVGVFAVVVGVSLLMSAVLHWPVHEYAKYSIRGASEAGGLDYGYATSWSLHPLETLTFIVPFAFGFGKDLYYGFMPFTDYPNYLGVVVLVMAVTALATVRTRYVRFLAFITVVAMFVAFGKFFPVLYKPLFALAPFFNKFRVPVMVLIVQQMAVVLLFGIGLDAAMRAEAKRGRQRAVKWLAVAFAVFTVVVLSQGYWSGDFAESISGRIRAQSPQEQLLVARAAGSYLRDDLVKFALLLSVTFILLFAYYSSKRMNRVVFAGLALVVGLVDYYLVDRNILHPEEFRHHEEFRVIHDESVMDRYCAPDSLITFLLSRGEDYRVFPIDHPRRPFARLFASNRFMIFGIASMGGYHAAKLSAYEEFLGALAASLSRGRMDLVNMLNARYVVSGAPLEHPRLTPVWSGVDYQGQPRFVFENADAMPRAFFVDGYKVATGREALTLLAGGTLDLRHTAILDRRPALEPVAGAGGEVTIVSYGLNRVKLKASNAAPSLLVLADVYYPDWRAEVDGRPTDVLRANHVLRAVALPAGEHDIEFAYDASLIVKSLIVSATTMGAALVVLLGSLVAYVWKGKRGSSGRHTHVQRA